MNIAVIGSGVTGLTSAICLQDAGFDITIFTEELPQNTTSVAAGAVWWGHGEGKVRQWADRSLKIFQQLIEEGNTGVHLLRLRDVYTYHTDLPWFHDDIPYCEAISPQDLDPPFISGFMMDVPLIEPPLYLPYLLKRYQNNGGEIMQQTLQSFSEISADFSLIINCTGVGARELARDAAVYPIRGQTVIVDTPEIQEGYMDDEHFTYIFPRNDGVLLGGIAQANQSDFTVDPAIRDDILARCIAVDARIRNRPIVKEMVGLRPGRHTVRLEKEQLSDDCTVIHNYGHGSIGFTLSWGCAEDVVKLVQEASS